MRQIEHNPNEPKIDRSSFKWIWVALWAFVVLLWLDQIRQGNFDWGQIALGFITAFVLTAWAIDISGNKIPENWQRKN